MLKVGDFVRLSNVSLRMCGIMHDDPIKDAVGIVKSVDAAALKVSWVGPGRLPSPVILASHLDRVQISRAE